MRQFGLIGYPLSHSFSKNYFSQKFIDEGIANCNYELYPIKSIEELPALLKTVPDLNGINVTIPYKEAVLPFLNEVSVAVKEIGACNCIRIKNGHLTGFNTDVTGFEQTILPLLKPHHQKALILGTGGASKAVAWVFNKLGIEYSYVSRKPWEGRLTYDRLDELIQQYQVIVNTTPLGMQPNINQMPSLPYRNLNSQYLCYDLIYNPAKTAFLQQAELYGAVIMNGSGMLQIQAEESWKIWNS
ncbi:MAG: shikimate dehydrogenase [Lacibacter sp.]